MNIKGSLIKLVIFFSIKFIDGVVMSGFKKGILIKLVVFLGIFNKSNNLVLIDIKILIKYFV